MKRFGNNALKFFSSYGLSIILLFLLLLLVFFGTLEQVNSGLYEVQRKYFGSLFVIHHLGPVPLPLPGVYLLTGLLFINLLLGGIVRAPKRWGKPGLLIAHSGIALLIAYGFVTHHFSLNGYMQLYEGESADTFESYYEWELAIVELPKAEDESQTNGREWVFTQRNLQLAKEQVSIFGSMLPFVELHLMDYERNCRPQAAPPGSKHAVEGLYLESLPQERETERNLPGLRVQFSTLDAPGDIRESLLWGGEVAPWRVAGNGKDYVFSLRRRRWKTPFTITLDRFVRELHPRTGIPSMFMSEVTEVEDGVERRVEIKMNEPLRQAGYTLYQASWGPQNAQEGARLFSVFSVVKNPAAKWPIYATYIITLGLAIHFIQKLWRYLRLQNRSRA